MKMRVLVIGSIGLLVCGFLLTGGASAQELRVKKVACGHYNSDWDWTIDKTADKGCPLDGDLAEGQTLQVNYTVTLTPTETSSWFVGDRCPDPQGPTRFWIRNLLAEPVEITEVEDYFDYATDPVAVAFSCEYRDTPVTFPFTMPNGSHVINCYFPVSGTGDMPETNTAIVTTASGNTYSSDDIDGPVVIDYTAEDSLDECVSVTDDFNGALEDLGEVCVDTSHVIEYDRWIGPFPCGEFTVPNTAAFTTNDSGDTGSDDWTVCGIIDCADGCTLTPGYWKTHSKYGPAPEDETWDLVPLGGADATFFISSQTWYQVLWTNPRGGNAYYILAHAYIAARLNHLNGAASTPEVDEALLWAEWFFSNYTPASSATLPKNGDVRQTAIMYGGVIDDYNNGLTGPGHCEE